MVLTFGSLGVIAARYISPRNTAHSIFPTEKTKFQHHSFHFAEKHTQ